MKARIKATGEIGIVTRIDVLLKDNLASFSSNKVEILQNYADAIIDPDYWTRLEHTYAGMAMQGILSNPEYLRSLMHTKHDDYRAHEVVPDVAVRLSYALVEKMKEEKK